MKTRFFPILALCALAGTAGAVRAPVLLSSKDLATYYNQFGNVPANPPALDAAFDADDTTGISVPEEGSCLVLDFTSVVTTEKPRVFVDSIEVVHSGAARMSLYTSDDGSTWEPVAGAQNVRPSAGSNVYRPQLRALYVKYVFESRAGEDLKELRVNGWISSVPHVVSKWANVQFYQGNGTIIGDNNVAGGNTGSASTLFDGVFGSYQMFPRIGDGYYCTISFTNEFPNGCYVEKALVDTTGAKRYSVYYSADGTTWTAVNGAVAAKAAGTATYQIGASATMLKYVFVDGSIWDYSTTYIAEIQVWGMDADDLPCLHPDLESIPWTTVENSATCTERGEDERFCPVCGERFTKVSDAPPLGHDYVSTLVRPGGFKKFGTGAIACTRCDYRIDFSNVPETALTNGPVDMVSLGGLAMDNLVQFTDLTVTSTDHQEWGPNPAKIIDGSWVRWWISYWVSAGLQNQHADFNFGTEIDLTQIQIVLQNSPQTILFFDVDDETGDEKPITQFTVRRVDVFTNATDVAALGFPTKLVTEANDENKNPRVRYRFFPAGENGEYAPTLDYGKFGTDFWDSLVVTNDLNIPALRTNPDGTHPMHQRQDNGVLVWEDEEHTIPVMDPDDNDSNQFQAFVIRFYEQPCKHLRIRNDVTQPTGYQLWSGKSMSIIECHPWGIVRGAGETRYRKETLLIFR